MSRPAHVGSSITNKNHMQGPIINHDRSSNDAHLSEPATVETDKNDQPVGDSDEHNPSLLTPSARYELHTTKDCYLIPPGTSYLMIATSLLTTLLEAPTFRIRM